MSLRQRRASPSSDPPPELVDSSVLPSPCAPPAARSSSPGDCGGSRQVLATLGGSPASTPSMLSSPGGTEAAAVVAVADWMGEGKRDCLLCVLAAHTYVYIHTSMYASIHTNAHVCMHAHTLAHKFHVSIHAFIRCRQGESERTDACAHVSQTQTDITPVSPKPNTHPDHRHRLTAHRRSIRRS